VMMVSDITLFLAMSLGLFFVDVAMALFSFLLFGGVAFALYVSMRGRAQQIGKKTMDLSIATNLFVDEVVNSYREAIVRNRRSWYLEQIRSGKHDLANLSAEMSFMPNIGKYVIETTMILSFLIISGVQFIQGTATSAIANIAIFMAAGTRIAPALLRIQQGSITIKNSLSLAKPTLEILTDKQYSRGKTTTLGNTGISEFSSKHKNFPCEAIISRDVSFSYLESNGEKNRVVVDVSLEIPFGSSFALVGPSGAGKSTLVDIILGLIVPDEGEVKIGDFYPGELINKWPGSIGYVPQNTFLTDKSVRYNLALGFDAECIDESEYKRAVEIAQLSDFVDSLPQGLDTPIGEAGSRLSGGQRQRLGIARALMTNPKILILDEATSALDSTTEFEVTRAIQSLKSEVTVIVIAHRLSTVKEADQVAYMESGRLIKVGKFVEVKRAVPNFAKQARLMGL